MDLQWMRMVVGDVRSKSSVLIVSSLDVGPLESLEIIGPLHCIVSVPFVNTGRYYGDILKWLESHQRGKAPTLTARSVGAERS